jgi:hypothetical protein
MTSTQSDALRTRACGIALIAAPLTLTVSDLVRQANRIEIGELLAKVAVALFVPAVFGLVRLARERAPLGSLAGMTLCLIGLLNVATISTITSARWSLSHAGLAPGAQATVDQTLDNVLQLGALFPLPAPAFATGLMVLSVVLYRTRAASRLLALCVLAGAILFPIGRIGDIPAVVLASDLALIVGLVPIGLAPIGLAPMATSAGVPAKAELLAWEER